jgi:carbonic anhydrase
VVQEAWNRGQALTIHGWIFGLTDGLVRDLSVSIDSPGSVQAMYEKALLALNPIG